MHPMMSRISAAAANPDGATSTFARPSRRGFLLGAAAVGAGLTIAFKAPGVSAQANPGNTVAAPNPFQGYVRIAPDNSVTVWSAHMDMGQGCYHGIATLVLEELGADWAQLQVVGGSGNLPLYGNLVWGGMAQGTGGSTAMASSWDRYRKAGAMARTMLVGAAAAEWKVPAEEITAAKGMLTHRSGKSATFGQFADAAARQKLPTNVKLKGPADWTLIGNEQVRRFDRAGKAKGAEDFTIDVQLPGMLTAVVARPPLFGGKVKSFDVASAKAVAGVEHVVAIPRGVAIVARNSWAAMKGREALKVEWDLSGAEARGSDALLAEYERIAAGPATFEATSRGDAPGGLAKAAKRIEATYSFPFLAHAAMEPLDAIAGMRDGVLEIWGGHQMPDLYQQMAAASAGLSPDKVRMHIMKTGGGFGRRAVTDADVVMEAVETAKAIGWAAPVKVLWTREDDMTGGRYRPMAVHKVVVGLDGKGDVIAWRHHVVSQSVLAGTPFAGPGLDPVLVEGIADTPYDLKGLAVEGSMPSVGVPVLWWRSVGHTHTAYVMETMIDQVARAAGQDPVALRRRLLKGSARHVAALDLAAEKAGWGKPLPAGRALGVAVHQSFGTVVAQVAEVSLENGQPKVHRVVAAVDCGVAINPDTVRAQIEGGVGFGLGAIWREEITLDGGRPVQTNYDAYTPLRIQDMPKVEVHIVPSSAEPTGVGEPGVPPIGPAVANALAALTGRTVTRLPLSKGLMA